MILYFYPKDNTPGCTKEACGFRDIWHAIQERRATVLGISPDSQASHQQFVTTHRLPFPLLCDPDKKVMTRYGAYGEKTLYGKKTLGVIRSTRLGRTGRQSKKALEESRQSRGTTRAKCWRPCSKMCKMCKMCDAKRNPPRRWRGTKRKRVSNRTNTG